MSDSKDDEKTAPRTGSSRRPEEKSASGKGKPAGKSTAERVRSAVASAVWLLAVLAALLLAVGALVVALGFNSDHPLVEFIVDTAQAIDLGELKSFEGQGDSVRTKWVLVNWGIASLAYLVVGKVLDRVIRPGV